MSHKLTVTHSGFEREDEHEGQFVGAEQIENGALMVECFNIADDGDLERVSWTLYAHGRWAMVQETERPSPRTLAILEQVDGKHPEDSSTKRPFNS